MGQRIDVHGNLAVRHVAMAHIVEHPPLVFVTLLVQKGIQGLLAEQQVVVVVNQGVEFVDEVVIVERARTVAGKAVPEAVEQLCSRQADRFGWHELRVGLECFVGLGRDTEGLVRAVGATHQALLLQFVQVRAAADEFDAGAAEVTGQVLLVDSAVRVGTLEDGRQQHDRARGDAIAGREQGDVVLQQLEGL